MYIPEQLETRQSISKSSPGAGSKMYQIIIVCDEQSQSTSCYPALCDGAEECVSHCSGLHFR